MNEINKRVTSAQRRLWIGKFGANWLWIAVVLLVVCLIAVAIPKIWSFGFLAEESTARAWNIAWIGGALFLSLLAALFVTWLRRPRQLDAAIEVDRRYQLKERVSSALMLDHRQSETPAGRALISDAQRRAETIDIRDQFGIRPSRWILIPIFLVAATVGLSWLGNAVSQKTVEAKEKKIAEQKQVKTSVEAAKKKLTEKMKQFEQKGLKDLKPTVESIEKKLDKLDRNNVSKKEALIELNNIQKEIADKQKKLGDVEALKKQLSKLAAPNDGVTKEFADALKKSDFKSAQTALKKLSDQLGDKKLSDKQKKQLAKDLSQMAEKMNEMAQQTEQKKQDLQRQIDQAAAKGDNEKAARLQQQLDQLKKQNKQSQQMKDMAKSLQQCANCMNSQNSKQGKQSNNPSKQGQSNQQMSQQQLQQAQDSLQQMSQQLEQMQNEMDQMQTLSDLSNQMSECKGMCQGNNPSDSYGKKPGNSQFAKGRGPGGGEREKSETDTGLYKSKVKANVKKGETVITGDADGPNRPGVTKAQARELVKKSMGSKTDPLDNQKLPKSHKEQALEYFQNMRGGKGK